MNDIEIYKQALKLWGYEFQETMLIEECSELIQAICKRKRNGEYWNLLEELMDVKIMVEQIELHYKQKGLECELINFKAKKLIRLQNRIDKEKSCKSK